MFMSKQQNEFYWISHLVKGERKAINYFVETYGNFMFNVCNKILLSRNESEEATQDAIMKAVKAIETYDQKSSIKAWCYTIAYRTAIDYKRKIKYTTSLDNNDFLVSDLSTDHQIESVDTSKSLNSLLLHLDDESKLIVTLYYLEEKSIKEVCDITQMAESNIKIKLFRARKVMASYAPKYFEQI
jgi:RNA polymerase sigma factor (sigma-70 family)